MPANTGALSREKHVARLSLESRLLAAGKQFRRVNGPPAPSPWPHFDQKLSLSTATITRSRSSYLGALDPSCPVKSEATNGSKPGVLGITHLKLLAHTDPMLTSGGRDGRPRRRDRMRLAWGKVVNRL